MLSYQFLVEHGIIVPKPSPSCCFPAIDFPSTWECKQGFLALMTIKSKSRNCLGMPEHDFRCAVSKVVPCIDQLVEKNNYIHRIKTICCVLLIFWLFMSSWTDVCLTLIQLHAKFFLYTDVCFLV